MKNLVTLIRDSDSASFFDWDEVARKYASSREALTQAVTEAVVLNSRTDVESSFNNLRSLVIDVFDEVQSSLDQNSDPVIKDKLGVSLMRCLYILSAISWAVPDFHLAERYPMRRDVSEFVDAFYQQRVKDSGTAKTWTDDLKAGNDPTARYKDKKQFGIDKSGLFSETELFRDSWKEFENDIVDLELEVDDIFVEKIVELIMSEPSPIDEWIYGWLKLLYSYPLSDYFEDLTPRMRLMRGIAVIRHNLVQALDECGSMDIERTCLELAQQYQGWMTEFQNSPELAQDKQVSSNFNAMTSLIMAFAHANNECQEIIVSNTSLRQLGYL